MNEQVKDPGDETGVCKKVSERELWCLSESKMAAEMKEDVRSKWRGKREEEKVNNARARNGIKGRRNKDQGGGERVHEEKERQRKVAEKRIGQKQVRRERPAVSLCDVTQVPHGRLGE